MLEIGADLLAQAELVSLRRRVLLLEVVDIYKVVACIAHHLGDVRKAFNHCVQELLTVEIVKGPDVHANRFELLDEDTVDFFHLI